MIDKVLLYISAASDLARERDLLGRAVAEIPTSLGWQIVQSPLRGEAVDLNAVAGAHVHLILIGSDIRAPIGQEWLTARRAGRRPLLFLKQDVLRTPAAQDFVRHLEAQATWEPFKDGAGLRRAVLLTLVGHLVDRALTYLLAPAELERLQAWRTELAASREPADSGPSAGTGESGVIFTRERYLPSQGVLIKTT